MRFYGDSLDLHMAALVFGFADCVKVLIQNGADVNAVDDWK